MWRSTVTSPEIDDPVGRGPTLAIPDGPSEVDIKTKLPLEKIVVFGEITWITPLTFNGESKSTVAADLLIDTFLNVTSGAETRCSLPPCRFRLSTLKTTSGLTTTSPLAVMLK